MHTRKGRNGQYKKHWQIGLQVKAGLVLRDFNFAIVDEVDSILIDEARTPIIISGTAGKQAVILDNLMT